MASMVYTFAPGNQDAEKVNEWRVDDVTVDVIFDFHWVPLFFGES